MKKLLLGFLFLISTFVWAQSEQKTVYVLDSARITDRNSANVMWLKQRELYAYNSNALLIRSDKIELKASGQKNRHDYTTYEYDENGNKTSQINYVPVDILVGKTNTKQTDNFKIKNQKAWEYNSENKMITQIIDKMPAFALNYTYDQQGRLIKMMRKDTLQTDTYEYDADNRIVKTQTCWNIGSNDFQFVYKYDECGKLVQKIRKRFNYVIKDWKTSAKYVFEYNKKGYKTSETYFVYNSKNDTVELNYRDSYGYNKQGNVVKKVEWRLKSNFKQGTNRGGAIIDKDGNMTNGYSKRTPDIYLPPDTINTTIYYKYDENNNLSAIQVQSERRNQKILPAVQEMAAKSRKAYTYDKHNNLIEEILYAWEQDGWKTIRRKLQYWSLRTVEQKHTTDNANILPDAAILPQFKDQCSVANPYRLGSVINCEGLEENKSYQLLLFDLLGRLHYQSEIEGNSTITINAPLPLGTYLVVIKSTDNTFIETHKIILTY